MSSHESQRAPEELGQVDDYARLLSRIVDSWDDAIITKTRDGVITSWNKGAERIFGYTADEAIGQNISLVDIPTREQDFVDIRGQIWAGGRIDHYQTVRQRKGGDQIHIWLTLSPIRNEQGVVIGISMLARDITDAKRAEEELFRLTAELRETNADLLRINQELDDFAYIASHDLKEPLRGIDNYATFLIEDYGDKLDEEGRTKLSTLKALAERMYTLIDSLLEYSRIGRVNLAIQKIDLNAVVEDVVHSLHVMLEEQHLHVRVARPLPMIECDRVGAGEIFRNLITNAIKYNDKAEKSIEIDWHIDGGRQPSGDDAVLDAGKKPPLVIFSIRDNGIGIQKKHFESIFRIFKRLHARDRFGGGTGVGLTIVKKIVERHNGRIWLESVPGQGTTFFFTLAEGHPHED